MGVVALKGMEWWTQNICLKRIIQYLEQNRITVCE